MAYSLYNGNKYATRDGVVSSGTMTNPDVDGGSLKMMGTTSQAGIRATAINLGNNLSPSLQPRVDVMPAHWSTSVTGGSATSGNGVQNLLRINFTTGNPHGLTINQVVVLTDSISTIKGAARIYSVPNTTGIILNRPYQASTGNITVAASVGTMSNQIAGNYVMRGVASTNHGQSSISKLLSPASDYGRNKFHRVLAVRTSKVATAIRAGYWNVFTGSWTTAPTVTNDYTDFDLDGSNVPDDEAKSLGANLGVGGEFAYSQQRAVVSGNYDARTG